MHCLPSTSTELQLQTAPPPSNTQIRWPNAKCRINTTAVTVPINQISVFQVCSPWSMQHKLPSIRRVALSLSNSSSKNVLPPPQIASPAVWTAFVRYKCLGILNSRTHRIVVVSNFFADRWLSRRFLACEFCLRLGSRTCSPLFEIGEDSDTSIRMAPSRIGLGGLYTIMKGLSCNLLGQQFETWSERTSWARGLHRSRMFRQLWECC